MSVCFFGLAGILLEIFSWYFEDDSVMSVDTKVLAMFYFISLW